MDSFGLLLDGLQTALQPEYLLYALLGVFVGTAVGVLPGIGPAMTLALLLPLTYQLDPAAALIVFAGIYYGGMYGGSTTSILLNTPGESASVVTALEGNRMAKAGRASAALATAALGSFVAGTLATVALTFVAPTAADLAVQLGAPDYVALMVLSFIAVGALLGSSAIRGLASLALGLFIGLVGLDGLSAQSRFTFDQPVLTDGIDVTLVAVGLFAVGEAFYVGSRLQRSAPHLIPVTTGWRTWLSREELSRSWRPWLRGSAIGFPIGSVPGGGADMATFLSYSAERNLAKGERKRAFGKGAIEGVAGPEAANNAAAAGVLVPLLTLGIPTTATAAMMVAAFQTYNIPPGPQLFDQHADLVWALVASLYIGNLMLLVLNLPLIGLWVRVLKIPRPYLYAGIVTFAALGAFATNFKPADISLLIVLGLLGFFMRRYGYPVAPLVVGAILGPMLEEQLRRALQIDNGNPWTLVGTPFTIAVYSLIVVGVGLTAWARHRAARALPVPVAPEEEAPERELSVRH